MLYIQASVTAGKDSKKASHWLNLAQPVMWQATLFYFDNNMETNSRDTPPIEICYECYYFREYAPDGQRTGHYLCVNPESYMCDKEGVGKATRACKFAKPHDWRPPNIEQGSNSNRKL